MGMTTFALFRLFSSLETADEDESLFGGSILGNRPLLMATGLSVLTIVLAIEFGFLQRLLGTTSLTIDQWVICIVRRRSRSSWSRRCASCSRSGPATSRPRTCTTVARLPAADDRSRPRPGPAATETRGEPNVAKKKDKGPARAGRIGSARGAQRQPRRPGETPDRR